MAQNTKKILALSGSTKAQSINKAILNYVSQKLGEDFELTFFDLDALPHFNPDLDTETAVPEIVTLFRKTVEMADGVLICTPEYVFSLPGVLKNALEWLVSTVIFERKPTAFIVASTVGEKAFESLQLVLKTIGADIGEHSAVLFSAVKTKINPDGTPKNADTEGVINLLIDDFKKHLKN